MGVLRVMGPSGDRSVSWSTLEAGAEGREGEPDLAPSLDAQAAVAEAARLFEQARARGGTAFRVRPGEPAERIDAFDPSAEQIIVVPQVVGG